MFSNYLKIAWRNLLRNKLSSAINLLGLTLGLTCSLLIILWVRDERGVDSFHANVKQLYQVYERRHYDGKIEADYYTQGLLAQELKRAIPEIEYACSMETNSHYVFEANDKIYKMEGTYAGSDLFKMFSYHLLFGTAETALNTPTGVAISRKMAELFFGSPEQAMGKVLRYENKEDLMVTAVFENLPPNSSQQFDFLRNWEAYARDNDWVSNWGSAGPATYLQLHKNADPVKVEAKIKDFIYKYQSRDAGSYIELGLQRFSDKYLHSSFDNGRISGGRIEYVVLFSFVAALILLIACTNFMNLATARSMKRAKEVGVRKVVGALRSMLMIQFAGEAILLTFFSIVIAVVLVIFILPGFNSFTGKQLTLPVTHPMFWLTLFGLVLATGFVAGSYPAIFLSSLNPLQVLKGSLRFSWGSTFFRKCLVVFQFALSCILIVSMIVVYRQMNFLQNKNLGYNRDNLVYIPMEGELIQKYDLFKEEAGKKPGVSSISRMRETPTVIEHHKGGIGWEGKDPNQDVSFADAAVGYDFVKTMQLTLVEGRDFSPTYGTDSASYIVNESAVKKMNYKDPIGKPFYWDGNSGKIIGVLKDFHFNSMHQPIEPLFIRLDRNPRWGTILVRTQAGKTKEALAGLGEVSRQINPKFPFTYQFSDQEYEKLYKSEQVVSTLVDYFAFIAIFISCLGLFGLALYATAMRTKEIAVRKVLGAFTPGILAMLWIEFLKPVVVAILIAFPVAWYAMNRWLNSFAYKTNIEWWIFGLAALLTIGIALLTVSFQSIKAAGMNPVKSLRTE